MYVCMYVCMGALLLLPVSVGAVESDNHGDDIDELSLYELRNLETFMVTATKRKISTRKAPAIATVITADEIKNMGARDLTDVLKTVPGFGVAISSEGYNQFEVRGISTTLSEKILVMIDGHRVNTPYMGSGLLLLFDNLSLEKVRQVEIIRDPALLFTEPMLLWELSMSSQKMQMMWTVWM